MATLAKRATISKQVKKVKRELTLEELAHKELGWDPRITIYVTSEAMLRKYQRQKGKFFVQPNGPHEIGGYKLTQVGAWRENDKVGDKRIVWTEPQEA